MFVYYFTDFYMKHFIDNYACGTNLFPKCIASPTQLSYNFEIKK